jgi:hypothetical protein
MKRLLPIMLLGSIALAACAANGEADSAGTPEKPCKAEPGQAFIGQKATAEVGQKLLKATGARTIRWVPPRTAVTMDFRPDRLTVGYDDDMVIDRVSCT